MTYSAVDSEPILECLRRMRAMAEKERALYTCGCASCREQFHYWSGRIRSIDIIRENIETRAVRWEEERGEVAR